MSLNSMYTPSVRITHIPTGIVVECSGYNSREANHNQAMKILRAKLYDLKHKSFTQNLRIEHGSGDYLRWPGYEIQGVMDGVQPEDK